MERVVRGKDISEEQIDGWVDEAKCGYDLEWLRKRMGRSTRTGEPSPVVPVRLPAA